MCIKCARMLLDRMKRAERPRIVLYILCFVIWLLLQPVRLLRTFRICFFYILMYIYFHFLYTLLHTHKHTRTLTIFVMFFAFGSFSSYVQCYCCCCCCYCIVGVCSFIIIINESTKIPLIHSSLKFVIWLCVVFVCVCFFFFVDLSISYYL